MREIVLNNQSIIHSAPAGDITPDKKQRESGLELLRLVAMLLVVACHYMQREGTEFSGLVFYFASLGVMALVLISGYFLSAGSFSLKKLVKLVFQISFFSFIVSLGFYLFHNNLGTDLGTVFIHLMPVSLNFLLKSELWFVVPYMLMYLCSPLLNIIIKNISKWAHLIFLFVGLIYFLFNTPYTTYEFFPLFLYMYFIAAYVRKYPLPLFNKMWPCLLCAVLLTALQIIRHAVGVAFLVEYTNPLMHLSALFWFFVFKNMKFSSKTINICAASTLIIYVIHQAGAMHYWLWSEIFVADGTFWHMVMSVGIVFFACMVIGIIYNFTINRWLSMLLDKKLDRLQEKLTKKRQHP